VIRRCLEEFPDPRLKLLDYGCYDGKLFECLKTGLGPQYIGVDINAAFIALARKRWKDYCKGGRTKFILGNVLTDETFSRMLSLKPDVVVASGVMSYAGDAPHYPELLDRLFACAQQAVIFNVLSADTPKNLAVRTKGIIRWQPEKLLKLVRACGCNSWELIRSYLHNDITVVMRKKWTHFE
jgi:predicted TPR repeat methyltransferase